MNVHEYQCQCIAKFALIKENINRVKHTNKKSFEYRKYFKRNVAERSQDVF